MKQPVIDKTQVFVAALASLIAAAHLTWEYTHGGIVSHHFLADPEMPAISNLWGLLILPLMAWLTTWIVLRRVAADPKQIRKAVKATSGSMLIGIALSVSFYSGYEQIASYIFYAAILSGVYFPIYRAEYVFGFVLGMMFVFGAMLPTLFALIAAAISAVFHLLLRPAFMWAVRRTRA